MVNRDTDVVFHPDETPGRYAGNPVVREPCAVYCVDVAVGELPG